jgi:tetratricopeptide (TPR) repeat protein/tRNA A-37 threonylcarbamoyl transferase component Bud32
MTELPTGTILDGQYEILAKLGEGPNGCVYKARHRLMKRTVAIKIFNATCNKAAEDIQQRARAVSAITHPNINAIHDFGVNERQQPFVVMGYVDGSSLATLLQTESSIHWQRAGMIFLQACRALAHAHRAGVIHGNLKPSNLLLAQSGTRPDFVKLVDFGLPGLDSSAGDSATTAPNDNSGAAVHASPEQKSGQEATELSDIYALGCIMYESLTGQPANTGQRRFGSKAATPSFACASIEPELAAALKETVLTCLHDDPDLRFQSMDSLRKKLEQLIPANAQNSWQPLPGKLPGALVQPVQPKSRQGQALAFFLGLAAVAGCCWLSFSPAAASRLLTLQLQFQADTMKPDDRQLLPCLTKLASLYAQAGDFQRAADTYLKAEELLVRQLDKKSPELAAARLQLSKYYLAAGDTAKAKKYIVLCWESYYVSSNDALNKGEYDRSGALAENWLSVGKPVLGADNWRVGDFMNSAAKCLIAHGKIDDAIQVYLSYFKLARNNRRESGERRDRVLMWTANGLAQSLSLQGNYKQANYYADQLMTMAKNELSDDHRAFVPFNYLTAHIKIALGQHSEAKRYLEEATRVAELHDVRDAYYALFLQAQANMLLRENRVAEAENLLEKAIANRLRAKANLELADALLHCDLAGCKVHDREFDSAEENYRKAIEELKTLNASAELTLPPVKAYFDLLTKRGKAKQAEALKPEIDKLTKLTAESS